MIYITGDTHGDINDITPKINKCGISQGDILVVCGDFGFTLGSYQSEKALEALSAMPFTIAFVDGNHENFNRLYSYPVEEFCGGKAHRVRKNIYHLMRGECFEIEGHSFFCFGGAYSVDKGTRYEGISWWPQELPGNEDYDNAKSTLERLDYKVDYVLTHTVPESFIHRLGLVPDRHDAELTGYFEWLYRELDFKKWYAGHFHVDNDFGNLYILYEDVVKI